MPAVVLIDDELLITAAMAALVNLWGYEAVTACSEDDAVAKLDRSPAPALLVVDWRLAGGRTGGEAVARIRAMFRRPIPAIVVTGETSPGSLREIREFGCPVLHKPVMPLTLKGVMQDALEDALAV